MIARQAFVVFVKEMTDSLRDRRSLVAALAYSLFGPLVLAGALVAVAKRGQDDAPLAVAVAGAERAPSLVQFLGENKVEIGPAPADPEAAVRAGELVVALRVATDYGEKFRAARPAPVELIFDSARAPSREAATRLRRALERYGAHVGGDRLVLRGVSPAVASAVEVAEIDLATPAARAATVLAALPMFLLMAAFVCGMSTAIDATAGERERGSLEGLLLHPVDRRALVAGKWLAAAVLSGVGVGLTVLVTQRLLVSERLQGLGYHLALGSRELLLILLVLAPLALLAPALQLLVALFSHDFKEAQTYLSLLLFVPLVPGFVASLGSQAPAPWLVVVPLLGQQLLVADVLKGEAIPGTAFALAGLTVVATAACLAATAALLGREKILLGR